MHRESTKVTVVSRWLLQQLFYDKNQNMVLITCCFIFQVIKDDDSDQVHVYKDNRWTALCYSDDLTLAEYLCSITGFG